MQPLYRSITLIILLTLTGCATLDHPPAENDPLERFNRSMYMFNDKVDQYVLKPVATGYDKVTPAPVQKGVSNFFSNLDDVLVMVNDLLQLKLLQFSSDLGRFVVNTTLGIGGLIDWASDMGLPKHNEDFGQTLGYWGTPSGPYLVLPFLGPSTIRDTGGLLVDGEELDPIWNKIEDGAPFENRDENVALGLTALKVIDIRASLLKTEGILDEAALDKYNFIREAYLQRRQNLVYDGNPPQPPPEFNEKELFDF